ncbi:MAG: glycyl radical protein [Deltaproteobacteria bacterium]|nr:glycyl radical protein [Deltaproteobacteria bacterium]MBW1847949.1 glycyl radical protein [Deltaproteobacteria bacterium]
MSTALNESSHEIPWPDLSEDLRMLRQNVSIKVARNVRKGYEDDENVRGMYRSSIRLNVVRNRLLTESYKATEGEPMVLRRAKSLAHILKNLPVYIMPYERIVGHSGETPDDLFYPVEVNWKSAWRAMNSDDAREMLDDEGRAEMEEIIEYWKGKTLSDLHKNCFKGDLEKYFKYEGTFLWSLFDSGAMPDFERLFKIGLKGLKKEAEEKLQEVIETVPDNYLDQHDFLQAVLITLDATIDFAKRYSKKASEEAAKESDPKRKEQLEDVARICGRVPEHPPETLHEALQFFWFITLIKGQIEFCNLGGGGRFDVLFNPFYQKDISDGRITRQDAVELMQYLFVHFEESGEWFSPMITGIYGGVQQLEGVTIGGIDKNGNDVTNDMTYITLEAGKGLRQLQPTIALRVHKNTPEELLSAATDVIRTGIGYPSLFNDEVMVPLINKWGTPLKDARNYHVPGCVYLDIPGKNTNARRASGYFVLPKCLWWALRQGIHPDTGEQHGAPTPDPETFTCIEDVIDAFVEQVRFFFSKMVRLENTSRGIWRKYAPRPFLSSLLDGCIDRALDTQEWVERTSSINAFNIVVGPTNVADSLAAIKKLVFDDKELTMKEFIEIMNKNWEGHEDLRQKVINQVPKFGNDDDYVDLLAKQVHERSEAVYQEFTDEHGAKWRMDGSGVSATYGLAFNTPATPDGRKDGEPFSDATLSPMIGRDKNGPTAVLKSCAKIDPMNQLLNQKFIPQFLEGENKKQFINYLRTWCDMGVPHIQFNVVDKKTLQDAQNDPNKYSNLIVRVAGYSTYFVDISKGLQDHIIARAEQSL